MAKKEEQVPAITDVAWDDYVMSKFDSSELIDGHPNVVGLRRVARLLVGKIVDSYPSNVVPMGENRATVSYMISIVDHDGTRLTFGDCADVTEFNTDIPFCLHAAAVASTRAEARALRKALCLKKVSSEELNGKNATKEYEANKVKVDKPTTGEVDVGGEASDSQKKFIAQLLCDVEMHFDEVAGLCGVKKEFEQISKQQASDIITFLKAKKEDLKKKG